MQIKDNLASLNFIDKLTPEVLAKIDEIFPAPEPASTYFSLDGFQNIDQPIFWTNKIDCTKCAARVFEDSVVGMLMTFGGHCQLTIIATAVYDVIAEFSRRLLRQQLCLWAESIIWVQHCTVFSKQSILYICSTVCEVLKMSFRYTCKSNEESSLIEPDQSQKHQSWITDPSSVVSSEVESDINEDLCFQRWSFARILPSL